MSRRNLLEQLNSYVDRWPAERECAFRIRHFVQRRADCFERTCREGHITASAWVVSADGRSVLLTRHRKLGIWLQLGGHADGDPDTAAVALREAREESGLESLAFATDEPATAIFDVDVHLIPARSGEPEHFHYDVRYNLSADADEPLTRTDESTEIRWVLLSDLRRFTGEESVLRMARKSESVAHVGRV